MIVTHLKTNLSDLPSSEPAREERMAHQGVLRYQTRQQRLADRGTAADRDDYASVIRRSLLGVADRVTTLLDEDKSRQAKRGGNRSSPGPFGAVVPGSFR